MYFERLQQKVVKPWAKYLQTLISLFMEVNFEPYRAKFENLIGRKVDSIELFPASEGFLPIRILRRKKGMLLLNAAFYEFVKSDEFYSDKPRRYT
jgi:hypothetical protein